METTAFIPPSLLLPVGAGQSGQPLHVVLTFVLDPDHCRLVSYEVWHVDDRYAPPANVPEA